MITDLEFTVCGVVAIIFILALTLLINSKREVQAVHDLQKMKIYYSFLNAITDLNVSGGDDYKVGHAKMELAKVLNGLNLVGGREVLTVVNELLDFLNENRENEYDLLKEKNLLNQIVISVRKELEPTDYKKFLKPPFRFKFYSPPKKSE